MFVAEQKRKMFRLLKSFSMVTLFFYFGFHLVSGEKGVLNLIQLEQKVIEAKLEAKKVRSDKIALSDKVQRLYESSLDIDLLDEQARKLLGKAPPSEVIYFRP